MRRRSDRLRKQTQEAEHMAFVGTLTGGLAHEIKNPLSTLNLNIQLMREDLARPATDNERRVARKLEVIESQTQHLSDILEKFLRFAGRHKVSLVPGDVNHVLSEIVEFYRPQLERSGIKIRTRFADPLEKVELDADLFKQAVANLVINAQGAMPGGGELMVTTRCDDRFVTIDITDTGMGIEKENLEKVFDVYYSTRKGGLGLGLPTVQRIVREHNGRMEIQSDLGRGTQMSIVLPVAGS
jgi:signal transduction histidine kinase